MASAAEVEVLMAGQRRIEEKLDRLLARPAAFAAAASSASPTRGAKRVTIPAFAAREYSPYSGPAL